MNGTLDYTNTLTVVECGCCYVTFAIPDSMYRRIRQTGDWFWCPSGHQIHYSDSENTKLKARLDQAKADAAYQKGRLEDERKAHVATKGALTKTRNRVKNGVCPCCHRSFVQLERHMKTKHPEFQ